MSWKTIPGVTESSVLWKNNDFHTSGQSLVWLLGTPWWPSGYDSTEFKFQSLVGELRFMKASHQSKKTNKQKLPPSSLLQEGLFCTNFPGWDEGSEN